MNKPPLTTHILNLDTGKPATGVWVTLYEPDSAAPLATAKTDADGRVTQWDNTFTLTSGFYRLHFAVGDWFAKQEKSSFYPEIVISFHVVKADEHYHVPLLLNAYGYSTYRGS